MSSGKPPGGRPRGDASRRRGIDVIESSLHPLPLGRHTFAKGNPVRWLHQTLQRIASIGSTLAFPTASACVGVGRRRPSHRRRVCTTATFAPSHVAMSRVTTAVSLMWGSLLSPVNAVAVVWHHLRLARIRQRVGSRAIRCAGAVATTLLSSRLRPSTTSRTLRPAAGSGNARSVRMGMALASVLVGVAHPRIV